MLHHFVTAYREELIWLTRQKIAQRTAPRAIEEELEHGVPLFLDHLVQALDREAPRPAAVQQEVDENAARHGQNMLRQGFTVSQLVHNYGAVCQAITQLAGERGLAVSAEDYRALNSFLDEAIAQAVTGYGKQREQVLSEEELGRLGFLAHELRNLISTALLAYQMLKSGRVAITGNTGGALGRSLKSLRDLVDRSLAEVRLTSGIERRERVLLAEIIALRAEPGGQGVHFHHRATAGSSPWDSSGGTRGTRSEHLSAQAPFASASTAAGRTLRGGHTV